MKPIGLIAPFVFFLASAVSATVFQPASDRQLVDRSDTVVVATVRDAATRVRSDGYVVTDYRLDVEQTLKGTAAGTITVSEIGGEAGQRFTIISDSAAYSPGEHVLVFLKKRSNGTYFTTSMAMGKFSFARNAAGEAVVTRDVSELRGDPARAADAFARFVREAAQGLATSERSTTTLGPIGVSLHAAPLASPPASAYCLTAGGFPVRWQGVESGALIMFYVTGTLTGVPNAASDIAAGMAAWSTTAHKQILKGGGAPLRGTSATPNAVDGLNIIYLSSSSSVGADAGSNCDGGQACTIVSAISSGLGQPATMHSFMGETFISISDADIVVSASVPASEFEALITHELGHAIGFRHSDAGTPFSSQAIMATNINAALRSNLQQWDHDAVDTVYGNGPACVAPNSVSISGGGAVPSGQTATLTASVAGSVGPFTYAWFEGFAPDTSHPVGVNPMAPSSSTFTTPAITTTKYYWVSVSDACGSATAGTIVYPQEACTHPSIVTQSSSQTITSGSTATLNVNAGGTQPLSYQWYEATSTADTSKPVGQNSALFTTPALTQSTSYWVMVTNKCGTANSNVVTISIEETCTKPMFTLQPSGGTGSDDPSIIAILAAILFPVMCLPASAPGSTSYQWYEGNAGDTSKPIAIDGMSIFDRWGNQIYSDLLRRRPSASELSTLNGLLAAGTSRRDLAYSLLRSSEYQQLLLTGFYSKFLRRNPTAAERSAVGKGDPPVPEGDPTLVQILASREYFVLAGGTNDGWIDLIFNDVLDRPPSGSEVINFTKLLSSTSRATVGLTILNSSESTNRRVQEYYTRFLRRPASPAEISGVVTVDWGDGHTESIILGCDEYFNFGTVIIREIRGLDPGQGPDSYWARAFNVCGSTNSDTAVFAVRPIYLPLILRVSQNVTVNVGTPASVAVLASVAMAYQYQWYGGASGDQSNPINGAIGPVLTMTPTLGGSTQYWVKLWNAYGSANSNTLTITALQQRRRATSR